MNNDDMLKETIENSINDSLADPDPIDTNTDTDTPAPDTTADVAPDLATDTTVDHNVAPIEQPKDEFAERFGVQGQSFTGKENRIPYSRVKKIVSKAETDAKEALRKQLEGEFNPKLSDFETKIKTYETQLAKVAELEQLIEKDPQTFLGRLSQHPTYKPFFDYVNQLAAAGQQQNGQGQLARDPNTGQFVAQQPATNGMPQPDKQFADGTVGYSEQGLAALLDWQGRQVEGRVTQRIEQRYAPIEQEWQTQRRIQEMTPHIERQIAEARTWDRFTELEPAVIQLLSDNKQMSLERAYMQAYQQNVIPKLVSDKNKMRSEVLEELKKTPTQTAAPARRSAPAQPASGPRDIEAIIREQIEQAR